MHFTWNASHYYFVAYSPAYHVVLLVYPKKRGHETKKGGATVEKGVSEREGAFRTDIRFLRDYALIVRGRRMHNQRVI